MNKRFSTNLTSVFGIEAKELRGLPDEYKNVIVEMAEALATTLSQYPELIAELHPKLSRCARNYIKGCKQLIREHQNELEKFGEPGTHPR